MIKHFNTFQTDMETESSELTIKLKLCKFFKISLKKTTWKWKKGLRYSSGMDSCSNFFMLFHNVQITVEQNYVSSYMRSLR